MVFFYNDRQFFLLIATESGYFGTWQCNFAISRTIFTRFMSLESIKLKTNPFPLGILQSNCSEIERIQSLWLSERLLWRSSNPPFCIDNICLNNSKQCASRFKLIIEAKGLIKLFKQSIVIIYAPKNMTLDASFGIHHSIQLIRLAIFK